MANGSRHSMRLVPEVTHGTTPATPAFKPIRHTGTTLGLSKESLQSEEIRDDRQIADFRHGAFQTAGDINVELSYGSADDMMEAVLCGTWAPRASITGITLSASSTDNSFNDSALGFITAGFEVGDKVAVVGFSGDVANNITSGAITVLTAGKMTIGGADGDVIVTDAAGESVTISTLESRLKAGTTRRSFTIERFFGDLESAQKPYHRFTGVEFNTLALSVTANAMITAVFGVLGKNFATDTDPIAGATLAAATTTSPLDSFTGVLKENGSVIAVITEIQLNLENGLEARYVVGSKASIKPSIGRSNCSGTITAYFEDSALMDKFVNETESDIEFTLPDGAGNQLTVTVPRIKYNGGQPDVKGEGPITLSMPFQGLLDSTTGTNLIIDRKPA